MPDPSCSSKGSAGSQEFTAALGQLEQLQLNLEEVRGQLAVEHEREIAVLRSALVSSQRSRRELPLLRPPSLEAPCEASSIQLRSDSGDASYTKQLEASRQCGSVVSNASCASTMLLEACPVSATPEAGCTKLLETPYDESASGAAENGQHWFPRSASRIAIQRARSVNESDRAKGFHETGSAAVGKHRRSKSARNASTNSLGGDDFMSASFDLTTISERQRRSVLSVNEGNGISSRLARVSARFEEALKDQSLTDEETIKEKILNDLSIERQSIRQDRDSPSVNLTASMGTVVSRPSMVTFEDVDNISCGSQGLESLAESAVMDAGEDMLPIPLRAVWDLSDEDIMKGLLAIKINNRASGSMETKNNYKPGDMRKRSKLSRSNALGSLSNQARLLQTARKPPCSRVLHPQSNNRFCWDLGGLVLIFYDLLMVPLQFFNLEETLLFQLANWIVCMYWTFDIVFSLRTGVYVDGDLVMEPKVIFCAYAKTWMVLDFAIVAIEWISNTLAAGTSGVAEAGSAFRFLRMMRFLRLLRLMKCERLVEEMEVRLNSNSILLVLGIVKQLCYLVMINHVLACFWYGIGLSQGSDGWADKAEEGDFLNQSFLYKYFTSLHWSLSQFHSSMEINPGNVPERIYACVVVMLALVLFSSFLSSITNMMLDLHSLRQGATRTQRMVRNYLAEHNITKALSFKVKKYIDAQKIGVNHNGHDDEQSLKQLLPENLMTDLLYEARVPILVSHQLFWDVNKVYPRTSRQIAKEAVTSTYHGPCDMVFTSGDAGERALFIDSGRLAYRYGCTSTTRLSKNSKVSQSSNSASGVHHVSNMDWVGEAALWMVWEHKGELTSVNACHLLILASDLFSQVVAAHASVLLEMARYAEQFSILLATRPPSDIMDVPPHVNWELGVPLRSSMVSSNAERLEVSAGRGAQHHFSAARLFSKPTGSSLNLSFGGSFGGSYRQQSHASLRSHTTHENSLRGTASRDGSLRHCSSQESRQTHTALQTIPDGSTETIGSAEHSN